MYKMRKSLNQKVTSKRLKRMEIYRHAALWMFFGKHDLPKMIGCIFKNQAVYGFDLNDMCCQANLAVI